MDRCRVWESHANPDIRRVSKPDPEPIYPAYAVGDSDKVVEEIRVAAVTKPKSTPDQVEDLFRRLLAGVAPPAPVSGGSRGGEVVTASGGGDADSPACSSGGVPACRIGKFTQIVTLGAAGAGTTASARIPPA